MTVIHTQSIGGQVVVPKQDFERLLELARKYEPVDVQTTDDELSPPTMMGLAESGGAFDFWNAPGEDIYSAADGERI